MDIDEIITTIKSNLKKNGFPDNKVTFPVGSLTNFLKKYDFDLDDVLGTLQDDEIYSKINEDKVLFSNQDFSKPDSSGFDFSNINLDALKNMDPEQLKKQASEFMKTMSPEQMKDIKQKYDNMSEEERDQITKMSQKIGL